MFGSDCPYLPCFNVKMVLEKDNVRHINAVSHGRTMRTWGGGGLFHMSNSYISISCRTASHSFGLAASLASHRIKLTLSPHNARKPSGLHHKTLDFGGCILSFPPIYISTVTSLLFMLHRMASHWPLQYFASLRHHITSHRPQQHDIAVCSDVAVSARSASRRCSAAPSSELVSFSSLPNRSSEPWELAAPASLCDSFACHGSGMPTYGTWHH